MDELEQAKSLALTVLLAYTLPLTNRAEKAKECAVRLAEQDIDSYNREQLLNIASMSNKEVHICLRTLRSNI